MSECRFEPLAGRATSAIGIQYAEDDACLRQPAQSIRWKVGAAGAEGGQVPAHRGQPVEGALDEINLSATGGPFEAKDRLFAGQSQVLHSGTDTRRVPPQEPDRLAATKLGDDDSSGETFAQHSAAFARFGSTQQSEFLGDTQATVFAQMRLQGAAVGVPQAAGAHHPFWKSALDRQIRTRPCVAPERIPVQGSSGVQHQLLLEGQSVPAALCRRWWCARTAGSPGRWRGRCTGQPCARVRDRVEALVQPDEIDHVAACLAPEADEALPPDIHEEAGIAILVEGTQALPPLRARTLQNDSFALHDIKERVSELDCGNVPLGSANGGTHGLATPAAD